MFQRILVPLDGSPGAECAIPVAASLARQQQGSLVFLHLVAPTTAFQCAVAWPQKVMPGVMAGTLREEREEARRTEAVEQVMTEAASYLALLPVRYADELAGVTTEMHLAFGTASPTLPSTAHLEHVDLIVLCRHREIGLGQWGLESVAQQVMRQSPVPLLILHEHEQALPVLDGTHPLRVVVPLDGTLFAETALGPALHLLSQGAAVSQRELCLLHVVDLFAGDGTGVEEAHRSPYTTVQAQQTARRYLQMVADQLRARVDCPADVCVTSLVTSGVDIASTILAQRDHVTERASGKADAESIVVPSLIVIATHGREGIQRSLLGSVAERVLNATTTPMMTVCPRVAGTRLINFALPAGGRN
ncbi:MAG TPA: universal stress protein [Ktedonobacteraceae bacterium]